MSNLSQPTKNSLEDDDEFEDFPVDTWQSSETMQNNKQIESNLWEEDWDDVEVDDDFTRALKEELDKNKQ